MMLLTHGLDRSFTTGGLRILPLSTNWLPTQALFLCSSVFTAGFLVFGQDKLAKLLVWGHTADLPKHCFDSLGSDHLLEVPGRFVGGVIIAQGQGNSVDDTLGDKVFGQTQSCRTDQSPTGSAELADWVAADALDGVSQSLSAESPQEGINVFSQSHGLQVAFLGQNLADGGHRF